MPSTTQCNQCGIVLNVPDQALGRRLKCPRCGTRFGAGPAGSAESSILLESAGASSSQLKIDSRPPSSAEALPVVSGDLRDVYGAPRLNEVGAGAQAATKSAPAARKQGSASKPVADARSLFDDVPRQSTRRQSAAEARSKSRRCPTCGAVVPAGMSLCSTCGLDLETGSRVSLEDDLAPPPPRRPALPLTVSIMGAICLLGSTILSIATASLWIRGFAGFQYFVPICLFGVFASVQFLRQKSVKPLLMALTFGVAIDIVALIAMPIYRANVDTAESARTVTPADPEKADLVIPSVAEKLDTQTLTLGISLIAVYAGAAVYLLSPAVKRHFR
jgi:hypothetical protein